MSEGVLFALGLTISCAMTAVTLWRVRKERSSPPSSRRVEGIHQVQDMVPVFSRAAPGEDAENLFPEPIVQEIERKVCPGKVLLVSRRGEFAFAILSQSDYLAFQAAFGPPTHVQNCRVSDAINAS